MLTYCLIAFMSVHSLQELPAEQIIESLRERVAHLELENRRLANRVHELEQQLAACRSINPDDHPQETQPEATVDSGDVELIVEDVSRLSLTNAEAADYEYFHKRLKALEGPLAGARDDYQRLLKAGRNRRDNDPAGPRHSELREARNKISRIESEMRNAERKIARLNRLRQSRRFQITCRDPDFGDEIVVVATSRWEDLVRGLSPTDIIHISGRRQVTGHGVIIEATEIRKPDK